MKKLYLSMFTLAASASAVLAGPDPDDCLIFPQTPGCSTPVPEISALEGVAAIAAIAAILLLTFERRRRAS